MKLRYGLDGEAVCRVTRGLAVHFGDLKEVCRPGRNGFRACLHGRIFDCEAA